VSGLTDVVAIASGAHHSLAIRRDGSLWAWGWNSLGELGDGTETNRLVPVRVSGISDVRAIAAGSYHSLAVKKDGTVWAWGWNAWGQLGDGGNVSRSVPGQVAGLSNATSVAAGLVHSLALLRNGSVAAWGYNLFGELGDGGYGTVSRAPVAVLNVRNATSIAAGWYYSLALTNTGVVWAFGENTNHGQLGDGSGMERPIPVALSGLGAVTEIAAGLEHSMLLLGTGSVFGFGKNGTGALGDSTLMDHHTPVPSLF
jgi:alpha-tubulin suppressor-like RCC1 family protein